MPKQNNKKEPFLKVKYLASKGIVTEYWSICCEHRHKLIPLTLCHSRIQRTIEPLLSHAFPNLQFVPQPGVAWVGQRCLGRTNWHTSSPISAGFSGYRSLAFPSKEEKKKRQLTKAFAIFSSEESFHFRTKRSIETVCRNSEVLYIFKD